jgi:cytochrome c oxidase subunit 2
LIAAALAVGGCTSRTPWVIYSRGPAEHPSATLWWLMLWISAGVFLVIVGMLGWGIVHSSHHTDEEARRPAPWGEPLVVIGGVGVTGLILIGLFLFSLHEMQALASEGSSTALTVHVVGHDWWWEAQYPGGAVTANEIHVPAGQRVTLVLDSVDVIHSFWVPQLAPKRDLIPGRTNDLWIEATAPGRYRGQCAEYCGLQHAHMAFWVYADRPADFASWLADQPRPLARAADPVAARGERVFMTSTCVGCHTIRGTPAVGKLGPDLTHLASRDTIAAGTLPNTPGTLADWISDPQDQKPGVSMPPTELSSSDLQALIAFLGSLR